MPYSNTFKVLTRDCDIDGRLKPSAMLQAMQEVATAHCESVSLDRGVTDGLGIVWVLSRTRVELFRIPVRGEEITLETYAMPMRHLFFPRAYVFRDRAGEIIISSVGLWLLMDVQTRKAVANPFVSQALPIEERNAPTRMPATVRQLNDAPTEAMLIPRYSDFDLNGHVNNSRYMDWCCNALGFDGLRGREFATLDINYNHEILPGQRVRTVLCREEDAFSFCGFEGEGQCFGISGTLRRI